MLNNQNIIFFALPKFHGTYTSTSASIAKELAKSNRVLWVENPFTWKDIFSNKVAFLALLHQLGLAIRADKDNKKQISKSNKGIYFITPLPVLPINFLPHGWLYNQLSKLNHRIVLYSIKKSIRKMGFEKYIYINSYNFYYPNLSDLLNPFYKVYHCVDGMMRSYSLKHGKYLENILLSKVDLVITTSPQLKREKSVYHSNTYCIPNAADFQHCSKATQETTLVPPNVKQYGKNLIGYVGNIERRIDFPLLKKVMTNNPNWDLLMIGPTMSNYIPRWIYDVPNIHFVGKIPYAQLPNYLKALKVTLIPYKIDAISKTIFPLKLYEYLGAGKPVVATNFNTEILNPISDLVYVTDNSSAFERAINHALENDSKAIQTRRLALAEQNTWQERGKEFLSLLEKNVQLK
ncbi:glycosyltransferase [Flammeovirgaceae bacterium SG7u.111]|nr:glycosyltransferase [Flammeovirgaceae bacterium SG7u.132]WPO34566.1 glycosyltransferase [Flammeovirgaceae bacterium SG7u.111]